MKKFKFIAIISILLLLVLQRSRIHVVYDFKPIEYEQQEVLIKCFLGWSSWIQNDTVFCGTPYDVSVFIYSDDTVKLSSIELTYENTGNPIIQLRNEQLIPTEITRDKNMVIQYYMVRDCKIRHEDLWLKIHFVDSIRKPETINIEKRYKIYKSNKFVDCIASI